MPLWLIFTVTCELSMLKVTIEVTHEVIDKSLTQHSNEE